MENGNILLEIRGLKKYFRTRSLQYWKQEGLVRAVDDVSMKIRSGETLGLVGESGRASCRERVLDHV